MRSIQSKEHADTCMEVLRVMQCTREEDALVAVAQGTIVEDSRDACRDKAMHMAGDFESVIAAVQHSRAAAELTLREEVTHTAGDFESMIAAMLHSMTAKSRLGALACIA